jgi:hypothetical protein
MTRRVQSCIWLAFVTIDNVFGTQIVQAKRANEIPWLEDPGGTMLGGLLSSGLITANARVIEGRQKESNLQVPERAHIEFDLRMETSNTTKNSCTASSKCAILISNLGIDANAP